MPQKSEGDCKWVLATGGIKENFTEFFSMIKYEDGNKWHENRSGGVVEPGACILLQRHKSGM